MLVVPATLVVAGEWLISELCSHHPQLPLDASHDVDEYVLRDDVEQTEEF